MQHPSRVGHPVCACLTLPAVPHCLDLDEFPPFILARNINNTYIPTYVGMYNSYNRGSVVSLAFRIIRWMSTLLSQDDLWTVLGKHPSLSAILESLSLLVPEEEYPFAFKKLRDDIFDKLVANAEDVQDMKRGYCEVHGLCFQHSVRLGLQAFISASRW